jgi:hypothetical protein
MQKLQIWESIPETSILVSDFGLPQNEQLPSSFFLAMATTSGLT